MSGELKKILYLEDDPSIAEIVLMALTEFSDYQVDHYTNGSSAVDAVDHYEPDLLLFDVMVPGMDGVETYKKIREKHGDAAKPIIFMTAKIQSHEQAQYREIGAIGVITKPFDALNLSGEIEAIWSQRDAQAA